MWTERWKNTDAPPFLDILRSPDTPIPNSASPESVPTVRQHRIDRKSGQIRKPTRGTTKPTGAILQWEKGKEAVPKEVFREGINTSLPNNPSRSINADYALSLQTERRGKSPEAYTRLRHHTDKSHIFFPFQTSAFDPYPNSTTARRMLLELR